MGRVIGIDLGTTNSVVAFLEGNRTEAITNSEGSKTTPSVVLFRPDEVVVGELAKRQLVTSPKSVVRSAKRLMGMRYSEISDRLEDFPYTVHAGEEDRAEIRLENDLLVAPEQISAEILLRMRETAEDFLGEEIDNVVITVPAYFNDAQRTATKTSAELAGLTCLRLLNEPTAAALAYGLGRQAGQEVIAVFDFGGGTFDISILQLNRDIYEVLATCGDTHLGGDDIDARIGGEIADEILQQTGIDPTQDAQAAARIHEAAEKAKRELSSANEAEISLPFIVADSAGPKHYQRTINRTEFIKMVQPILDRLIPPCQQVLDDAKVAKNQINAVLMVGGSTRIPRVREMVKSWFGREPNYSVNPDEAVALGAAIQASVMTGALQEVLLLDVTPLSLGIEVAGGMFRPLIPRNSSIPCDHTRKFTTVMDNQTAVVVNVLSGERKIAKENRLIAKFRLTGIPAMPKEIPEIEVRFSIDANGILKVTATDLSSGLETGVVVEGYGQMSQDRKDVLKVLEDADRARIEDEMFAAFNERRVKAERLQAEVDHLIELLADTITQEDLKLAKESTFRLDLAMREQNTQAMDDLEDRLQDILDRHRGAMSIAEVMRQHVEETGLRRGVTPTYESAPREINATPPPVEEPPVAFEVVSVDDDDEPPREVQLASPPPGPPADAPVVRVPSVAPPPRPKPSWARTAEPELPDPTAGETKSGDVPRVYRTEGNDEFTASLAPKKPKEE